MEWSQKIRSFGPPVAKLWSNIYLRKSWMTLDGHKVNKKQKWVFNDRFHNRITMPMGRNSSNKAHGIRICIKRKELPMVNFLIFVQKNVSTIRFQEIKIRPFGDFEKMRFLCFYIIKSMARKGYFGPKSDFRGSKIPPRGASSTWNM